MYIQQAYQSFFSEYGRPYLESNEEIRIWLLHPDALDTLEDVVRYDKSAAEYIARLESCVDILKYYRQELCKQYNKLATAASAPGIKLLREHSCGKIKYRITWYTHYIDTGKDVKNEYKVFSGRERHIAIKQYREYVKAHPGIIATMDIEKPKWER